MTWNPRGISLSNQTRGKVDPEELQRVMVCSRLIPFEGAVGMSANGVSKPETTLLCLVARAASKLEERLSSTLSLLRECYNLNGTPMQTSF
jgi:hypothetical protein